MSQRVVLILLALCVVVYLFGVGFTATREKPKDPNCAPSWIEGGLASALDKSLRPESLRLDSRRSPWKYEGGRLSLSVPQPRETTALLRVDKDDEDWVDWLRTAELVLVASTRHVIQVKFWSKGHDEPKKFGEKPRKDEPLSLTFPAAGGFLKVQAPARSTCTLEIR